MPLLISELYNPSLDVVILVVALTANILLAITVIQSKYRNATNRIFTLLALITAFWLFITYIVRSPDLFNDSLTLHRLGIFFAAPMSALLFLLAHTMPSETLQLSRRSLYTVLGATVFMMLLNVSPYAFVDIVAVGVMSEPVPGLGLVPFSIISTLFSILAIYILVKKYRAFTDVAKKQVGFVLFGMLIMLALIIGTILIPILAFNSAIFLAFTPLYVLIFLGMTAYAITHYQLFRIKVLVAQALTFTIWIVLFAKLFGEQPQGARIVDSLVFAFTVVFGFLLVRSVRKEVEQRELIEAQEKELEKVNREQEALLHFLSHEVKGYLAKGEAGFAAIVDGTYGAVIEGLSEMAKRALGEMRTGVGTVMSILDASNLKKGTVSYKKELFDFKQATRAVISELLSVAEEKGLKLSLAAPDGAYTVLGDEQKIRQHVIRNLIDNSVKYTPHGNVAVFLGAKGGRVRMVVEDTGIGITPEDMKKLFTEGGHGADSIKINVHSTGFGLFIAKRIVEAHGGKIWAESEGREKGSRFVVELPAAA